MTVDHIRPFSQGGGEGLNNLQLLCGAFNSLKGTGTMAELRRKLTKEAKATGRYDTSCVPTS